MKNQVVILATFTAIFILGYGVASAQPRHHGPVRVYHAGPHHHHHHYNRNLDSISRIFGAVAIIADSQRPVQQVVVAPPPPVVVSRPSVVVVETVPTVVQRPVVVTQPNVVYQVPAGDVGPLRTQFSLQQMKIPNFEEFTAAILITDPPKGSPLDTIGLRKGDAITRVNEVKVAGIHDLNNIQGETSVRYIKSGTTTVRSAAFIAPVAVIAP